MANLVFDFLHHYQTGERRASDPADAYQYDEGHVMEAVVPVEVTSCEIHYWVRGMDEAEAYVPTSITPNQDGSYTILGNIPNSYFETYGDLRVYIVVTDGTASITTYEGRIHICERSKPDDYVDDDPDNEAVQIIAAARGYAETSEAWAVGQINGEDVPSTADQYQNNASYYADQAASAASSAAAQASLAPAYDNTATYEVGDYCLYSGQLYECTTAITTAEAWDSTHWTAVTVGGELATVKDGLINLESDLEYVAPVKAKTVRITEFTQGYFNNMYVYIGSGGYLAIIEMQEGAKYIINTSGTYNRFAVGAGNSNANQAQMGFRYSGTASATNEYTYVNSSNYKYLFVWLNYGSSTFECTCDIREVIGDVNDITLNGVPVYNESQVDFMLNKKRDSKKYGVITNFLENGDFHTAGSPLQYANCVGAVSDGVLTVTGNGDGDTIKSSYYYPISDVYTNQYVVFLWVKANSANCKSIALRVAGGYGVITITKPIANRWYLLGAKYFSTSHNTGDTSSAYSIWATYADATAESGESISIKQAIGFMINTDFGIGTYPAFYKLQDIIKYNGFWMGSKNVIIEKYPDPITKQFVQKQSFGQKRRPLVTFVDDDGWQRVYEEFSPISEEYGVPFVSAIQIGSTILDWNALYLQDELGWELAVHPDPGVEGGLASLETEEEIEQCMVDTNNYLSDRGYKWQNVVYAHGEPDERVRRIAKKFYRCGAVGSSPKVNRGVIANFEIQRIPIGYPMDSTWNTFANLKSFIDDAIANNGWCIFMTHVGMTNWHTAETTQIVEQLVDYCVNTVNVDIVTLNDGFNVFGNAIETGDFLGENARAGDDKTKGVAISQDGLFGNVIGRKSMDNLLLTLGSALGGTFTTACDRDTGEYTYTFTSN